MKPCTQAYLADLDRWTERWREEVRLWESGEHPLIAWQAEHPREEGTDLSPQEEAAIYRKCIADNEEMRPYIVAERYGWWWSHVKWPEADHSYVSDEQCCPWGGEMSDPKNPFGWRNYVGVMAAVEADPTVLDRLGPIEVVPDWRKP